MYPASASAQPPAAERRDLPYGQQRYTRGAALPTELKFTGQREEAALGLYDYGARWYDPALGRFLTPDTLIPDPGNPMDWDRFAYTRGNPVKYTDPSGHWVETALDLAFIAYDIYDIKQNGLTFIRGVSLIADVAGAIIPVVTGVGLAVRTLSHVDDVVDTAKVVDTVVDSVKAAENVDEIADAVSHGSDVLSLRQPNLPKWPTRPEEMDNILGINGERIPDTPNTPGRNKVIWNPSDNIKITYEQHPYHQTAPDYHKGPHWHMDYPGITHKRYLPGQDMPE